MSVWRTSKALRDCLVCGLCNKETQKKLLTEEHTFHSALKVTLNTGAAEKDVAAFSQDGATPINKVDSGNRCDAHPPKRRKPLGKAQGKSLPPGHKNNNSTSECLSCGKMGYACSQCKYRNYTCHSCGRAGHITEACKSKPQKVNKVEETEPSQVSSHDSVDPFSTSLYNLGSGSNGIEVPVKLNGTPLFMELDTGAGVSFISSETYTRHFKEHLPSIQHSPAHLHRTPSKGIWSTGSAPHIPRPECWCPTYSSGRLRTISFWKRLVITCKAWLEEDMQYLFIWHRPTTGCQVTIAHCYPVLPWGFKARPWHTKGITAKLEMKSDAQPKFYKARPVPYSLQEAAEAKYSQLEAESIVEKVEFSEWATPMVHVPKSDGTTRSCKDYAVTVNPQLNVP